MPSNPIQAKQINTGTPVDVTEQANAEGTSQALARADHAHALQVPVQDDGVAVGSRPKLNFLGAGVTVSDDVPGDRINVDIPGGGTSISRMDASLVSGVVGEWQFDGDLTDSSGNGFDLSATNTPVRFAEVEGLNSVWCRFSQIFQRPTPDSLLQITGALTIHSLTYVTVAEPQQDAAFAKLGASGETGPTNFLYDFGLDALAGQLRYFAEEGSGTNIEQLIEAGAITGKWTLYTLTRDATGSINFYLDGVLVAGPLSLNQPTDGSSGFLEIENMGGWLGGLIIANQQASAGDVLSLAQQVGVA